MQFYRCVKWGNSPEQKIDVGPGYQTGFASEIKRETGIATMAVGQITEAFQAEAIIRTGQADMVSMARGMLADPRWAWHAAEVLGEQAAYAPQYMRSNKALRGLQSLEILQLPKKHKSWSNSTFNLISFFAL